ncbi:MAG: YdjY domain-containing protein [Phycisphaeraceae bacterium]
MKTRSLLLLIALALTAAHPARAQDSATTQPQPDRPLPSIRVDREAGFVEIDAEVVNRDADWLELLVCAPGSREYESILTSPAKPSHIHLALIMLGLEPGSPLDWEHTEEGFDVQPPTGPRLTIQARWQQDGEPRAADANTWIVNQKTDEPMEGNVWLFAGSSFYEPDEGEPRAGERLYMADLNGTVISLVNFGDDLLTRPTTLTNQNDDQAWSTRTEAIPPEGTAVTLRLAPAPEQGDEDEGDEGERE